MTSNKNIVMVVVLPAGLGLIYVTGLHDPKQYLYMALVSGGGLGGSMPGYDSSKSTPFGQGS